MPPDQRTNYHCDREATGPVDRKQLIDHINKIALETPDQPESVPFVAGVVRGKKVKKLPYVLDLVRRLFFFPLSCGCQLPLDDPYVTDVSPNVTRVEIFLQFWLS